MVEMRKIDVNRDSSQLFELVLAANEIILPNQVKCVNVEDFRRWLLDQLGGYFHDLYVIEENGETRKLIGFALAYDYRIYDRHCSFCIYSIKDIEVNFWSNYIDQLFKEYPLNKIFWEVEISNIKNLEIAKKLGFSKEMILKEYRYKGGQYLDVCVLSKHAQSWRNI
ncbi:MAG: GNAT family N-acetyltransferase [Traorella sp.]